MAIQLWPGEAAQPRLWICEARDSRSALQGAVLLCVQLLLQGGARVGLRLGRGELCGVSLCERLDAKPVIVPDGDVRQSWLHTPRAHVRILVFLFVAALEAGRLFQEREWSGRSSRCSTPHVRSRRSRRCLSAASMAAAVVVAAVTALTFDPLARPTVGRIAVHDRRRDRRRGRRQRGRGGGGGGGGGLRYLLSDFRFIVGRGRIANQHRLRMPELQATSPLANGFPPVPRFWQP
mmetsp:Transcript_8586/g.24522  ORF Transcript_8586/g.24522 Transcript_8586/m.24522 type:complete len:235 (-) Transcript_8586:20-724(-)